MGSLPLDSYDGFIVFLVFTPRFFLGAMESNVTSAYFSDGVGSTTS